MTGFHGKEAAARSAGSVQALSLKPGVPKLDDELYWLESVSINFWNNGLWTKILSPEFLPFECKHWVVFYFFIFYFLYLRMRVICPSQLFRMLRRPPQLWGDQNHIHLHLLLWASCSFWADFFLNFQLSFFSIVWAHIPCLSREYFPDSKHEKLSDLVRCKEYNLVLSATINWAPTICQALCLCLSRCVCVYCSYLSECFLWHSFLCAYVRRFPRCHSIAHSASFY